jgi:group II intron maturase
MCGSTLLRTVVTHILIKVDFSSHTTTTPRTGHAQEMIGEINPKLRGWGHYYQRTYVRKLLHGYSSGCSLSLR